MEEMSILVLSKSHKQKKGQGKLIRQRSDSSG